MASGFVKIAMDEFYSHNPNNWTGLLQRYWSIVEDEIAGKLKFIKNKIKYYIFGLFFFFLLLLY